jgi:bacterioferritin-associated ferredoxin
LLPCLCGLIRFALPKPIEELPVYVCICHAVTRTEFDAVVADGATSVDAVGERCGAGTGCGTCVERLSCLISAAGQQFMDSRVDAAAMSA